MDFSRIACLKGEFEAEGLSRDGVAAEALFAARHGLPYLVKIGGCEAKSDMRYLMQIGVRSIVAPMIESLFAMSKYMGMLPEGAFDHVGVTIETQTAVGSIEEILDAGTKLTEVTIGRTDLTASFGGDGVECTETVEMVKKVARAAGLRGLHVTMGGSVNVKTRELLLSDAELRDLVRHIETRKCVMSVSEFLNDDSLAIAFDIECALLDMQTSYHGSIYNAAQARAEQLRTRL